MTIYGVYSVQCWIDFTASQPNGEFVFAMRNLGSYNAFINEIELYGSFKGTTAKTQSVIRLVKFKDTTPTTGGAELVPLVTRHSDRWGAASGFTTILADPAGLTAPATAKVIGHLDSLVIPSLSVEPTVATAQNSIGATPGATVSKLLQFYRRDLKRPQYWRDELVIVPSTDADEDTIGSGLGLWVNGTEVIAGACVGIKVSWAEAA